MKNEKIAFLSLDCEESWHLEYLKKYKFPKHVNNIDGLGRYLDIVNLKKIPGNIFVVSELLKLDYREKLIKVKNCCIGSHTDQHELPLIQKNADVYQSLRNSKNEIEDALQIKVDGFRAPCFSFKLDFFSMLKKCDYKFDSSLLHSCNHPLYGKMNFDNFKTLNDGIYEFAGIREFEIPILRKKNFNFPIGGGGYLRILPWAIYKRLVLEYIKSNNYFNIYIHPFELSSARLFNKSFEVRLSDRIRASVGRLSVASKLCKLIDLLEANKFKFMRYDDFI